MRLVYSLLFYLATPFILVFFLWRSVGDSRWARNWGGRFAFGLGDCEKGGLLIHAASVGEVNAAAPLVNAMLDRIALPLVLSVFTPTGLARARELFGDRVDCRHTPLDTPGATHRFLSSFEPRLLLVMETEIWPNLLASAGRLSIPVVLVNARMSERSLLKYRRFGSLTGEALSGISLVLAQTRDDARRFGSFQKRPGQVRIAGNLKFDLDRPRGVDETWSGLKSSWGTQRFVVVAGSTHPQDHPVVLEAFRELLKADPDAFLVVAPRHPERFDQAFDAASAAGLLPARFSDLGAVSKQSRCLVLDTIGQLMNAWSIADLAYVGGGFSGNGGHNVLEPASLGVPIITGPDMSASADIMKTLEQVGAVCRVNGAAELAEQLIRLRTDPSLREAMSSSAAQACSAGKGTVEHTLQAIESLLA